MPRKHVLDERRFVVSGAGGSLRAFLLRERSERPVAIRLAVLAGAMLAVGTGVAAASSALLGQLIAGIALVPLVVAVYLRLLPPSPWTPVDARPLGRKPTGEDHDPLLESDLGGIGRDDWQRFERQFRAYVAKCEREQG